MFFYIYNWQTTFVDSPFSIFIIIKFIEKVNKNFNFSYFLFLLFESILIYKYKKRVVAISSYYFLVDRDGFGEPRRKNSPLDYFLFLLFESILIYKYKKRVVTISSYYFLVDRDGFEPSYSNENRFTVCRL